MSILEKTISVPVSILQNQGYKNDQLVDNFLSLFIAIKSGSLRPLPNRYFSMVSQDTYPKPDYTAI